MENYTQRQQHGTSLVASTVYLSLARAHENVVAVALEIRYSWSEIDGLKNRITALEKSRRASLQRMPVEIIEAIGSQTCRQRHLSRLSRTCRRLYSSLTSMLYRRDSHGPEGGYAWHWAIRRRRDETIRRAIAAGVNTGRLSHLLEAAKSGDCAMIMALLGAKAIRDEWYIFQDEDARDPVGTAIVHGHVGAVKLLLDYVTYNCRTWLHEVAKLGNLSLLQFLIEKGAKVCAKDGRGKTPLAYAVDLGEMETCRVLLENGAGTDETKRDYLTYLDDAASNGRVAIVDLLLHHVACLANEANGALTSAVRAGHVPVINLLIRLGCDVWRIDRYGGTLLHVAARFGHVPAMEILLQHGLDIDAAEEDGDRALHTAVHNGNLDAVKTLATYGADLEAIDGYGQTPLQCSVKRAARLQISTLLISRGANVQSADYLGNTVIHGVSDSDTLRLLLENGADLNAKNKEGASAFLCACFAADVEMLRLMLDHGADLNSIDRDGVTPIYQSACGGQDSAVEFLINHGASVNPTPTMSDGYTPLYEAANRGHNKTAKLLIEAGAAVDARAHEGWTPLHAAIGECSDEVIQMLLDHGADANARSFTNGATPLLIASSWSPEPPAERVRLLLRYGADPTVWLNGRAAIHGTMGSRWDYTEAIKTLVLHGVDANTTTNEGETPLMLAASRQTDNLVAWLLENGADATLTDNSGKTALHYATSSAAAESLLKYGADIDAKDMAGMTPLLYAARSASVELLNCLLKCGADVKVACPLAKTALHYAVSSRYSDKTLSLLEQGASVDVTDGNYKSPLFEACTHGDVDVAKVLLGYGADVHKKCDGSSPFNEAICKGQARVLQLLLEHDARVGVIAANGQWPLHHAAEHGHSDVVRLLLAYEADKQVVNEDGDAAFNVAMRYGHYDVAKLLE